MADPGALGRLIGTAGAGGRLRLHPGTLVPLLLLAFASAKLGLAAAVMVETGRAATLAYNIVLGAALLWPLVLLVFRRGNASLMLAGYLLQSLYLFADITYFQYFRSYLHLGQAALLWRETAGLAGAGGLPLYREAWVLLVDLPALILALWRFGPAREAVGTLGPWRGRSLWACLAALALLEASNLATGRSLWHYGKHEGEVMIVRRYGTLVNSLLDFARYPSEAALIARLEYGRPLRLPASGGPARDILCIQVEALDANILGQAHEGALIAPFLTGLRDSSAYFPYAVSYHMGGGTSDCEFSVLEGAEPFENYPALKMRNYTYPNSLVKVLNGLGYRTEAFHGNKKAYYGRAEAYPRLGFRRFHGLEELGLREEAWGAPDGPLLDAVASAVERAPSPFFFYVITLTTHGPYRFHPSVLGSAFGDVADADLRDFYRATHYADSCLRAFVGKVRAARPEALILLYGDHASDVDRPGFRGAKRTLAGAEFELVPLFLLGPEGAGLRGAETAVSFLDIAPTVLAATGKDAVLRTRGEVLGRGTDPGSPIHFRGRAYARDSLYRLAEELFRSR